MGTFRWPFALASLLAFAFLPGQCAAGFICGTVRDEVTQAPVSRAGVFVLEPAGEFTGLFASTDAQGSYCVENVPPGTYDLEVRVDGYLVAYVRGVVVTDGPVSVPVDLSPARVLLGPPWPNPARSLVQLTFSIDRTTPVLLSIFDARGRFLRAWSSPSLDPGTHTQPWDFRDDLGRSVSPGVYLVRLQAGASQAVRTVLRAR